MLLLLPFSAPLSASTDMKVKVWEKVHRASEDFTGAFQVGLSEAKAVLLLATFMDRVGQAPHSSAP